MGFRYNKSIAGKLFNYKQALTPDVINSHERNNFRCNCSNSPFKDGNLNHVVTSNLDIVQSDELKLLLKKGPKYRLPKKVDWANNRRNIVEFLEKYVGDWIGTENKLLPNSNYDASLLNDWKNQFLKFVDNRIKKGKKCLNKSQAYNYAKVKQELERLQSEYVMKPADKAGNNIIFTCKAYYIKSIKNELSSSNTYQFVRSSYNSVG